MSELPVAKTVGRFVALCTSDKRVQDWLSEQIGVPAGEIANRIRFSAASRGLVPLTTSFAFDPSETKQVSEDFVKLAVQHAGVQQWLITLKCDPRALLTFLSDGELCRFKTRPLRLLSGRPVAFECGSRRRRAVDHSEDDCVEDDTDNQTVTSRRLWYSCTWFQRPCGRSAERGTKLARKRPNSRDREVEEVKIYADDDADDDHETDQQSAASTAARLQAADCPDPHFRELLLLIADAHDGGQQEVAIKALVVRKLNEYWFFVKQGKANYGEESSGSPIPIFRVKSAFMDAYSSWIVPTWWIDPEAKPKTTQLTKLWIQSSHRRSYEAVVFDPSLRCAAGRYNTFKGLAIDTAKAATSVGAPVQPIVDHILRIWCLGDQLVADYVLSWMAMLVQQPSKLPATCIVLHGAQGAGKGVIVELLGQIVGQSHYEHITEASDVLGQFTAKLDECLLLFLDEAAASLSNKTAGRFKALITEPKRRSRLMRRDVQQVPNYVHVIVASNHLGSVPVENSDRRSLCLRTDPKYSGPQTAESKSYFDTLRGVPAEAFAHFLYTRDISAFDPRQLPATAAQREQKEHVMNSVARFWLRCLEDGRLDEKKAETKWPSDVMTKATVYQLYSQACSRDGLRCQPQSQFWTNMYKMVGPKETLEAPRGHAQARSIRLPDLATCRNKWRAFMCDPDWPFDASA